MRGEDGSGLEGFLLHHLYDHVVRGDGQQEDAQEVVDADERETYQVDDIVVDVAMFQDEDSKEGECQEEDSEWLGELNEARNLGWVQIDHVHHAGKGQRHSQDEAHVFQKSHDVFF